MRTQIFICLAPSSAEAEPLSNTIAESWIETELSAAVEKHGRNFWTKRNSFLSDCDGFRVVRRFDIPSEEANEHGAVIARALKSFLDKTDQAIDDLNDSLIFTRYNDGEAEEALTAIFRAVAARRTVATIERVGKHLDSDGKFDGRTFDLSLGIPLLSPFESILGFSGLQVLPARVDLTFDQAIEAASRDLSLARDFASYSSQLCSPTKGFIVELHH